MLMVDQKKMNSKEQLARLWVHENKRVFADRLTCEEDHEWYHHIPKKVKKFFNADFCILTRLKNLMHSQVQDKFIMEWDKVVPRERLVYGDFMSG